MNKILHSPEGDDPASIALNSPTNPSTPNSLNTSLASSNAFIDILNNSEDNITIVHNNLNPPSSKDSAHHQMALHLLYLLTSPHLTLRKNLQIKLLAPKQINHLALCHPYKEKPLNYLELEPKKLIINTKITTKHLPNHHE